MDPAARHVNTSDSERYRTLLEITNAMVSTLARDELFRVIAGALRRIVSFDRTAIFLHDDTRDVLRLFVLESSLPSDYFVRGLEMSAEGSHVGRVFQTQRWLIRRDLATEREYPMEERAYADGVRSYVVVPLVVRGKAIGTLAIASTKPGQYSEADAELCQQAANQVALAIENMKVYEDIAALKARLERENVYLQEEIRREHNFVEMVGSHPALGSVLEKIRQVASTDSTVLIFGETGAGKELVARAIHAESSRKDRPLVKVNCTAISAGLVESELFGHVKGAFTGAIERRIGRFELADGGTVFLDEVAELPLDTQVKLLRVLQEREFEPVGSNRTVSVDVRVIAATNRDLPEAVRTGRLRSDLFYRLNVVPIEVPPLRARRSDIPQLVMFFLGRYAKKFGRKIDTIADDTMKRLVEYSWPGNVRELQNVIERAVVLARDSVLEVEASVLPVTTAPADGPTSEDVTLEEVERRHIVAILRRTSWVIDGPRGAAQILGIHPNTLRSRMERLGIKRPAHEGS